MASDDVIELGSSDDDTEPPPKKKKPILNAMVHIPSKLPGLTIKPAKTAPSTNKAPTLATIKPTKTAPSTNKAPLLAKPIIVKTNLKVNPLHIAKPSTTAVRVPIQNKIPIRNDAKIIKSPNKAITIKPISSIRNDAKITKNSNKAITINPISNIAQNLSKTQVILTKVPLKRPKSTTEIKQPNVLTGLSPSITIKPVKSAGATFRPVHIASGSSTIKKRRIGPKRKQQGEVMTVDLDDDDESATASPQWYLRPGEQSHKETPKNNSKEPEGKKKDESSMEVDSIEPSMEEKNNKEPDTTKYVEITIEDSPLKPIHRHPDIGKELPITIEDSPVKPITKATNNVESDCETNEVTGDKNSKKKLNYPKESKNCQQNNVVEIEIDFQDSSVAVAETSPKNKLNETKKSPKNKSNDSEKPLENTSTESEKPDKQSESEKVNHSKTINNVEKTKEIVIDDKEIVIDDKEIVIEDDEFHPTYQKFINLCFQLENSEDMKKIVEKKIKSYYRQCPKDYVESEEFLDMVASKIVSMEASPAKMYLYIKDIVDELNLQRKMQKSVISEEAEKEKEANMKYYEESLSKYDSKKQRQIRKLEKTIKKLHRAIQKLEEQEVDFDDDEDSVYLLTERYKERMVRVHAKFCQLTNTKMPSEPRIHIEARPGRPAGPARKLEKWINRKVPIGTPLPFPDFHDVLRCVRAANEEDKLGWNDVDIMEEARDLFTRCGKKLQRRRQENEWRIAASRISAEADPAEISMELKKKLDENKTVAAKRETELLNKYVDRQNLLKLEAVEIGDKEAEESPLESEEEEEDVGETDNALDNKEKRKQRLKRLIEEKNKRGEEKDNAENKDSEKKNDKTECKDEISKGNVQDKANAEISEENPDNVEVKSLPSETGIEARNEDKEDSGTLKENKIENKKENSNNEGENKNNENKDSESNDSDYKVECDIDELHLLQKLHSENEANSSTADSSDSDSPIPISDSLDSYSDVENGGKMCDVISIENSSYSESEMIIDGSSKDGSDSLKKHKVEELVSANFEIEYSSTGIDESNKETAGAEAAVEMVEENILLASSDDEGKDNVDNVSIESTCINLRDDNISITETTVDGVAFEGENLSNDDNSLPENNNQFDAIEESSGVDNSHVSLITTQEIIEDSDRLSEKPTQLCPNVDIEMSDNNGSPKEDVVDIRSALDVNSVESTDMQADIGNQEDISEAPESMDISEPTCSEQGELTQTVTV